MRRSGREEDRWRRGEEGRGRREEDEGRMGGDHGGDEDQRRRGVEE